MHRLVDVMLIEIQYGLGCVDVDCIPVVIIN